MKLYIYKVCVSPVNKITQGKKLNSFQNKLEFLGGMDLSGNEKGDSEEEKFKRDVILYSHFNFIVS